MIGQLFFLAETCRVEGKGVIQHLQLGEESSQSETRLLSNSPTFYLNFDYFRMSKLEIKEDGFGSVGSVPVRRFTLASPAGCQVQVKSLHKKRNIYK
jgi:hypothetical protein